VSTNGTLVAIPPAHRKVSLTAGILYLFTFVSIPTFALYRPVKGAEYVLGSGSDNAAIIGGILEITVALAGIGTAVVLVPDPQEAERGGRQGERMHIRAEPRKEPLADQ